MMDERLDLSALDPTADAPRFELAVQAVLRDSAARRASPVDPLVVVARWRRPLAAAAALVAMLSGAALARGPGDADRKQATGIATAAGVPGSLADALSGGTIPDAEGLVFSSFTSTTP
jgi:hypothetical protein